MEAGLRSCGMTEQQLYDLAPALELMAFGLVLALGPLCWVWWRSRGTGPGKRLQALCVLTLFLTFDLVLFGAFTRLTDSGLGCPDWPGCYGTASPIAAHAQISEAQAAMPTGPVTHGKAWVEMIHRYLATTVGVLIIAMTVMSWKQARAARQGSARVFQRRCQPLVADSGSGMGLHTGRFRRLTVTMKLFPAIVTLHLLGGTGLLALLAIPASGLSQQQAGRSPALIARRLRIVLWLCLALLIVQVSLGGWVSTNYAVLACTTFPGCQGSWWPAMNFAEALQIWRPLGMLKDGSHISFEALTAIHYTHRLAAYVVVLALAACGGHCAMLLHWPSSAGCWDFCGAASFDGSVQRGVGLALVAAVLHTGGAAALVTIVVWSLAVTRANAVAAPDPKWRAAQPEA
jgi:cytochrome c oxidase assembly protein subunit 15